MTPTVPAEDLHGGRVTGVTTVTPVLVKYTDGYGKQTVRMAVVIPGGEVYFYTDSALDHRPAQQWIKKAIMAKLGSNSSTSTIEIKEDISQV